MGLHSKCDIALRCPWGSDSVPGTCGFTSCRREKLIEEANSKYWGDVIPRRILHARGLDYEIKW